MAAPVGPVPQPPPAPLPAAAEAAAPAPAGVGAAPDAISSAAPAAPVEPGYFEKAAHAIKDAIIRLYKYIARLFGCGIAEETSPTGEGANDKERKTIRRILDLIQNDRATPLQYIAWLRKYFTETEQNDIYQFVGADVLARAPRQRTWTDAAFRREGEVPSKTREELIEMGRQEIYQEPKQLADELKARLEDLIAERE